MATCLAFACATANEEGVGPIVSPQTGDDAEGGNAIGGAPSTMNPGATGGMGGTSLPGSGGFGTGGGASSNTGGAFATGGQSSGGGTGTSASGGKNDGGTSKGGMPGSGGKASTSGGSSSGGASDPDIMAGAPGEGGSTDGSGGFTSSSGGSKSSSGGSTDGNGGKAQGGASAMGGSPSTGGSSSGGMSSGSGGSSSGRCYKATRLWFEDFELGDYSRWTSKTYDRNWGNNCQDNGISTENPHTGERSQRNEITCPYQSEGGVHRGYGGLQFSGDQVVPAYTNTGSGINAQYGIVNTFHSYLDSDTRFENGKWLSLWTVNSACDWSDAVLTLGLEDSSNRLAAAHYWAGSGGTREFLPGAPSFPRRQWVRVTVYVNYHSQEMHVWQDGKQVSHVTFDRPRNTICQWHWGAYASGDNDDIVLYEDDNSIWKLNERWTDFSVEPWFGGGVEVCDD